MAVATLHLPAQVFLASFLSAMAIRFCPFLLEFWHFGVFKQFQFQLIHDPGAAPSQGRPCVASSGSAREINATGARKKCGHGQSRDGAEQYLQILPTLIPSNFLPTGHQTPDSRRRAETEQPWIHWTVSSGSCSYAKNSTLYFLIQKFSFSHK